MRYFIAIIFSLVFISSHALPPEFKIDGQWYVVGSTFPMWHKGDKLNPRFSYTPFKEGVWKDEVVFDKKNGKTGTYYGKDYLKGTDPSKYIWKGTGALFFLSSKWQVEYISSNGNVMLVSFKKTAFSPAGADVVCRKNSMTDTEKQSLEKIFKEKFSGSKFDGKLAWLKHQNI